jgi:hypothetical protein
LILGIRAVHFTRTEVADESPGELRRSRRVPFLGSGCYNSTRKKDDSQKNSVWVQLELLDLQDGLPGLSSWCIAAVGTNLGVTISTEKDFRTVNGQNRWLPDNSIEVTLEINENGIKHSERIRLENFAPKTLVLRENPALGSREVLRLMPVIDTSSQRAN